MPSNLYKLSLTLIDTEEGHLLIENFVNIFFMIFHYNNNHIFHSTKRRVKKIHKRIKSKIIQLKQKYKKPGCKSYNGR